jgi:hypothetical protein
VIGRALGGRLRALEISTSHPISLAALSTGRNAGIFSVVAFVLAAAAAAAALAVISHFR